eukprot:TRINITY_DN2002_c6_g1_i1.p1 TRINITY_DN2002_c6_g1~~TRINITY_DN2002_c6_g1_i1.p1  ORF type:complete len:640 (+),score=121.89 TRINITY_DN2002_c6_g1_i1:148-2067(+)
MDSSDTADVEYLQRHSLGELIDDAVRELIAEKPADPRQFLAEYLRSRPTELEHGRDPSDPRTMQAGRDRRMTSCAGCHSTEFSDVMKEYFDIMPLNFQDGDVDEAVVGSGQPGFVFDDLNEQDGLLVIDMQNDFVPQGPFNEFGGRLACPEGDVIAMAIVHLMQKFSDAGGCVIATRDYHPVNHCSFAGHGGHLPRHCVAGHPGAKFFEPIGAKLASLLADERTQDRTVIAFKGYHRSVDSFGGLSYSEDDVKTRSRVGLQDLPVTQGTVHPEALTGGRVFKCSALNLDGRVDVDAPPDPIVGEESGAPGRNLDDVIREFGLKRLFVCGLAFDYCVLDTTCNGRKLGFEEAYLIADAARPAYIPASDFHKPDFGSGFTQDPKCVRKKLLEYGAKFCFVRNLLPKLPVPSVTPSGRTSSVIRETGSTAFMGAGFPHSLGPWRLHLAAGALQSIDLTSMPEQHRNGSYRLSHTSPLQSIGVIPDGILGPRSSVNFPPEIRRRLGIPDGNISYCFAHALKGASVLAADPRYAWCLHDPAYTFFLLGGFIYFSQSGHPVAVLAVSGVGAGDQSVAFEPPRGVPADQIPVSISNRYQPAPDGTLLRSQGAQRIASVANHELDCEWGGLLFETSSGAVCFPYSAT